MQPEQTQQADAVPAPTRARPPFPWIPTLLVSALFATMFYGAAGDFPRWEQPGRDPPAYWMAGAAMREGGQRLYDRPDTIVVGKTYFIYIYPPAFAAIFAYFTLLPQFWGFAAWAAVLVATSVLMFWAVRRFSGGARAGPLPRFLGWLTVAVGFAMITNITSGQVNGIVVLCVAAGLWLMERERPYSGGLLIALAAHVKVLAIALLPLFIVQRRWRDALGTVIGLAVLYFLPLLWTVPAHGLDGGMHMNHQLAEQYVGQLMAPGFQTQRATLYGDTRTPNHSLSAVTQRYFRKGAQLTPDPRSSGPLVTALPDPLTRWGGLAAALGMYALALALGRRGRGRVEIRALAAGLAFMAANLGNLLCWPAHLVALTLIVGPFIALHYAADGPRPGRGWIALVCVLLGVASFIPPDLFQMAAITTSEGAVVAGTMWDALLFFWLWGGPTALIVIVWFIALVFGWRFASEFKVQNSKFKIDAGQAAQL